MKLLLSLALLAGASALSAAPQAVPTVQPAADPAPPSLERQELGRRFIALAVSPDDYLATMREGMVQGIRERLGANPDDETRAETDKFMTRFLALYEPKVRERLPLVLEAYAQVYAREFSADELRDMIAFAQTPAGRHYFARHIRLDGDPAVIMQEEGVQNEALPIMQQMEKEQCQARTAQRIAAGDKKAHCPLADKPDTQAG
jgi:Uncharacterized protein conserved in bacteria (DUF2059)